MTGWREVVWGVTQHKNNVVIPVRQQAESGIFAELGINALVVTSAGDLDRPADRFRDLL